MNNTKLNKLLTDYNAKHAAQVRRRANTKARAERIAKESGYGSGAAAIAQAEDDLEFHLELQLAQFVRDLEDLQD